MKVCLLKCANKEMHSHGVSSEDFSGMHKDVWNGLICDWCYWMFG